MVDPVIGLVTMVLGLAAGYYLARYFEDWHLGRQGREHDLRR